MNKPRELAWSSLVHFNDKQLEAQQAVENYKYILYGGAMGGGKSYWLRWMLVYLLCMYYEQTGLKGIRVGLFCEDYPSLKDRHISKIIYEFPSWLGTLNKGDNEFKLNDVYGSGVIAFRNLDDPSKYASSEFAAVGVDELTKDPKNVFDMLRTRMRWPNIPNTKFLSGTNPGGIGHAWVKAMFLDRLFEETEKEADMFVYIRATAHDNRDNLPDSYFDQLEGLPEEKRKAYLNGDWNLFEGQYFSEFNEDIHVVDPFPIPDSWRKFGAYDHGRAKPACFKWYAIDFDGNVWCYRELYINREDGSSRWEADRIAKEVANITKQADEHLHYVVADAAIFAKTVMSETIAEVMQRNGMGKTGTNIPVLLPSSKDRVAGWTLMHQYLYYDQFTAPRLHYFKNCYDSIRTIPSLVYDEHKPEDLDSDGEDHAADVDRYFLQTLKTKKSQVPVSRVEQKMIEFKNLKTGFNPRDVINLARFTNL
mgnify:CR=1 FL=1